MLARELKSKIKKDGKIAYFIVGQTFNGNSYTCQIAREEDVEMLGYHTQKLLPFLLSDNQFPVLHFEDNSIISAFKFNEKAGEEGELIKMAQPFFSFHVDDQDVKGKTIQNRIAIKGINRDIEDYPNQVKRLVNNFQDFLGEIAKVSFTSEYHQGDLFKNVAPKQVQQESAGKGDPFQTLYQATDEITDTASTREQIEGMQAATEEHLKKRSPKQANSIGAPVEVTEDEEV